MKYLIITMILISSTSYAQDCLEDYNESEKITLSMFNIANDYDSYAKAHDRNLKAMEFCNNAETSSAINQFQYEESHRHGK